MAVLGENELNPILEELFAKRMTVVVVSTIDEEYRPHTAPFHYLVVHDPKHLLLAVDRSHQTYQNIVTNGYVALQILDEGDIAVGINGIGRVVKEEMESDSNLSIFEIEIHEIKKDNWLTHFVIQGIRIRRKSEPFLLSSRKIFQELSSFTNYF